eukprot:549555_1
MFPRDEDETDDYDSKTNEQSVIVIGDPPSLERSITFVEDEYISNFASRVSGFVILAITVPAIAFYLTISSYISPKNALALYLFVIHAAFFGRLAYIVSGAQLYRIVPEYGNVRGWSAIRVQKGLTKFPRYAVGSISELSSIRGSITNTGMLFSAINSFAIVFGVFIYESNVWTQTVHQTIGMVLFYISGLGSVCVSVFELDPNHLPNILAHYTGAACCICANIGFVVTNQFQSMISWILVAVSLSSLACLVFTEMTQVAPSDDPQIVNRLSKKCIFYESGIFISCALAIDCYLADLNLCY